MPFPKSPKRALPKPPSPGGGGGGFSSGGGANPRRPDPEAVKGRARQNSQQNREYKQKYNPSTGQNGSILGGGGFNSGAAGGKHYGQGRMGPNMGKTTNKAGYGKRDAMNARAEAIKKKLGGM